MAKLLYTGKVKRILEEIPATATQFGLGYMDMGRSVFSVFDYGEKQPMPFEIKGKNKALYREAIRMFDVLGKAGIRTHFIEGMGNCKIKIRLARMLGYDEIETGKTVVYRLPIECVFSKVISPPASAHGRLRRREESPEKYGADHVPERDEFLVLPEIATSFSTKIEAADVYKDLESLARAAGLVGNEHSELKRLTIAAGELLIKDAEEVGLLIADGKFEFLLGPGRDFYVGDSGYSWDENRILFKLPDGRYVDLSKQFPRNVYTIIGWKAEIKAAQKKHPNEPELWPDPPELDGYIEELFSETCSATEHELCRIPGGPGLEGVAKRAADTLDRLKEKHHRDETGAEIS